MTWLFHAAAAIALWISARDSAGGNQLCNYDRDAPQWLAGVTLALIVGCSTARLALNWSQPRIPQLMLLSLAHLVGAAYDSVDGLVPDAVWLSASLGWIALRAGGLAIAPDAQSMMLGALVCSLLVVASVVDPSRDVGGADLAAILCSGLMLSRFQMVYYLVISTCLSFTGKMWGQESQPFIPYCLCATAFLSSLS